MTLYIFFCQKIKKRRGRGRGRGCNNVTTDFYQFERCLHMVDYGRAVCGGWRCGCRFRWWCWGGWTGLGRWFDGWCSVDGGGGCVGGSNVSCCLVDLFVLG